jgi:hypothetical protein
VPREVVLMILVLIASFAVQVNAIAHHGYVGQDYGAHAAGVIGTSRDWTVAFDFSKGEQATNPPLYVLLAGLIYRLGGDSMAAVADVTSAINALALGCFLLYLRRYFSASLWLALTLLLAFVPFRIIHSVVISHDALTFPFFVAMVWLIARDGRIPNRRRRETNLALIAITLALAVFEKYSFISLVPVVVWVTLHNAHTRHRLDKRAVLLGFGAVLPAVVLYGALFLQTRAVGGAGANQWRDFSAPPTMTIGDVIFPKRADLRLLDAPKYDQGATDSNPANMELIVPHRYSYLGLLHLASYTDILDIFQNDPRIAIPGARSQTNQARMSLAVKLSVPVTLLTITGVLVSIARTMASYLRRRSVRADIEALLLCSLATFAIVAGGLTVVAAPYLAGYWLPRLVMAPLVGLIALGFLVLDRWLVQRSAALKAIVLGYCALLAVLYCSFLFP